MKPQREKDPKKVAAGKKLAEKNRQAKAALDHEVKRECEMAEKEQKNENSPGWFPEMSFQTVLSIVGIVFTAIELYQRFRQKDSSGSVQSPISSITTEPRAEPRAEPRHSGALSGAPSGAPRNAEEWSSKRSGAPSRAPRSAHERSVVSSKIGMV